jgi:hypothetical protein
MRSRPTVLPGIERSLLLDLQDAHVRRFHPLTQVENFDRSDG